MRLFVAASESVARICVCLCKTTLAAVSVRGIYYYTIFGVAGEEGTRMPRSTLMNKTSRIYTPRPHKQSDYAIWSVSSARSHRGNDNIVQTREIYI